MTDITSETASGRRNSAQGSPSSSVAAEAAEDTVHLDPVACVELFYFAYRDFTCDPDTILSQYGLAGPTIACCISSIAIRGSRSRNSSKF